MSGYSPSNHFSILFVIISHSFIYFHATEKPRKPYGSGVSYVWTQCTLRYSIFRYIRSAYLNFATLHLGHGHSPYKSFVKYPSVSKLPWDIFLDLALLIANRADYSITVATRPDPTVRPPSRYRSCILRRFFRIFLSFYYHFQPEIRSVFLILNYFVIILLSQLLW